MDYEKLKKDFEFYLKNKNDFIKNADYYDKYIVIKDQQVIAVYKSSGQALHDLIQQGANFGDFIIQKVLYNDGSVNFLF